MNFNIILLLAALVTTESELNNNNNNPCDFHFFIVWPLENANISLNSLKDLAQGLRLNEMKVPWACPSCSCGFGCLDPGPAWEEQSWVSLEKGVTKTTATGLGKDEPSFPGELRFSTGCPTGPCSSYSPRCIPSSVWGLCAQPLPWPLGWHPTWPSQGHGSPRSLPPGLTLTWLLGLTVALHHHSSPTPWSADCGGHGCPQQARPQPWAWLSSTAWPQPCHATTAIAGLPVCVTGDRPWWPAPWGAAMAPVSWEKEEIHSVPYRQALPNITHLKRFFCQHTHQRKPPALKRQA